MFAAPGLPEFDLPDDLQALYCGSLGFPRSCLYANFVTSVDGIAAIPGLAESNRLIAAGSEHDRLIMGLLRACADAVVIGAGTLHGSPDTRWTPQHAYPPAADLYGELRRRSGLSPQPLLVVLSGSGCIDARHPGLTEPALVLTREDRERELRTRLPESVTVMAIGQRASLNVVTAIEVLQAAGRHRILCEGGPTLFGDLLKAQLVDELFLTVSPRLAGRAANRARLSLVERAALLPESTVDCTVITMRKAGSHLFLRYELKYA